MPLLNDRSSAIYINRRKRDEKGRKLIETVASAITKEEAHKLLKEWQSKGHQSHYYVSTYPAKANYTVLSNKID